MTAQPLSRYQAFRAAALAHRRTRGLVAAVKPLGPRRPRLPPEPWWMAQLRAHGKIEPIAIGGLAPRVFVRGEEHFPALRVSSSWKSPKPR
jgi:hypothetical protein